LLGSDSFSARHSIDFRVICPDEYCRTAE
jgi:hypothetical protein